MSIIKVFANHVRICWMRIFKKIKHQSIPVKTSRFLVRDKSIIIFEFFPKFQPTFFLSPFFLNTLKSDWKSDLGLDHVLLTIRCLLINPNAESALNEEAGKLLLDDYQEFANRARLMTNIYASKNKTDTKENNQPHSAASTASTTSATQPTVVKKKKRNLKRL